VLITHEATDRLRIVSEDNLLPLIDTLVEGGVVHRFPGWSTTHRADQAAHLLRLAPYPE